MNKEDYIELRDMIEAGEFNAMDASGGNFDDAFDMGMEYEEARAKWGDSV